MTSFTLKILAMIFMLIDHIGSKLPSDSPIYLEFFMRGIGRLAFPIFLFLIIEGFKHTSDVKKYIKSLYVFGIISAVPFFIVFGTPLNVFFTLGSVVLMLHLFEKTEDEKEKRKIFLIILLATSLCDWGFAAVPTVYFLRKSIKDREKLATVIPVFLFVLMIVSNLILNFVLYGNVNFLNLILFSVPTLFSIPLLKSYNGELGIKLKGFGKYFFYAFYPIHLILIYIFTAL